MFERAFSRTLAHPDSKIEITQETEEVDKQKNVTTTEVTMTDKP